VADVELLPHPHRSQSVQRTARAAPDDLGSAERGSAHVAGHRRGRHDLRRGRHGDRRARSGSQREVATPHQRTDRGAETDTSPVIAKDGTVWIGSGSSQTLYAVTAQGAVPHDVGFYFGTPVIDPTGTLIFSADGGASLRGIDGAGAQVFDVPFEGELHTTPARGWDGTLYVGSRTSLFATLHPPSSYVTANLTPSFDFETPVCSRPSAGKRSRSPYSMRAASSRGRRRSPARRASAMAPP